MPPPGQKMKYTPYPRWAVNRSGAVPWPVTGPRGLESWNKGLGGLFRLSVTLTEIGRNVSLRNRELLAQVPLVFREKGCFEVILPRAGVSQTQWSLWHKEQAQGHDR